MSEKFEGKATHLELGSGGRRDRDGGEHSRKGSEGERELHGEYSGKWTEELG